MDFTMKWLTLLHGPDDIVEIRSIDPKPIISGYFKASSPAIATELAKYPNRTFYQTLNVVQPACYARVQHERLIEHPRETTSDNDIGGYQWILIDADPVRPGGVNASVPEKEAARKIAGAVMMKLMAMGFKEPVVADSGNGYRYVTEATFDAYLWQTVENKQKFISQIMTSKSPVRSCEDMDETALSYAEIKALCAGDPRIKEKMDLDVDVARLKLMRADHLSKQFRLEDQLLKYFPQEVERDTHLIAGFEKDIATLNAHPLPQEDFVGMTVGDVLITDKEEAGKAILTACKEAARGTAVEFGSYRGLNMRVQYDSFVNRFLLTLHGAVSHPMEVGNDARGNITRLDNAIAQIPKRLAATEEHLATVRQQIEAAKAEVSKPFPQETELKTKSARLAELDAALNMDHTSSSRQADHPSREEER